MNRLSEQLQELPAFTPPVAGWSALQQRQRRRRRRAQALYSSCAAAAALLLTVGLLLWQPPPAATGSQDLDQLMERSRQLEHTLAVMRPQALSWDRSLARTATRLQNELALVDLQLNYAEDAGAERLWQGRVELMSQLVQTHEQAARPALAGPPTTPNQESVI